MRKLTDIADDLFKAAEVLRLYENVISKKTCNNCEKKNKDCEYHPGWGRTVRYNCPFWVGEEGWSENGI